MPEMPAAPIGARGEHIHDYTPAPVAADADATYAAAKKSLATENAEHVADKAHLVQLINDQKKFKEVKVADMKAW